jgi:transposase
MKSVIERVAELAMKLGGKYLAPYGSVKSRKDFTQRQLMTCLILKHYLRTSYRGVMDFLSGHQALREVIGLEHKLPHYTALQKFSARSEVVAIATQMMAEMGTQALARVRATGGPVTVAIDSTGLETSVASAHYVSRRGRVRQSYLKVSLMIVCGALMPLGLVLAEGPNNDKCQVGALLAQSMEAAEPGGLPDQLLADAGYDADWVHGVCQEVWKVQSVIKPVVHQKSGEIGGYYRPAMTAPFLKAQGYGRRWHIEAFFSGLKRFTGSTLLARSPLAQRAEAALKLLAYSLHR